uniref:RING-type domain-containing protein n=1 Tax=Amphimedon queenslandica TaxID=400682 RepID=A0A1X7SN72_AMPQE
MAEGGDDEAACQSLPEAGGYDYTYVEEPPKDLTCPICFLPCRQPQIIDCCGAKFCLSCIDREKHAGRPCPICRVEEFKMLIDKDHLRKILSLKVHCTQREEGCQWIGELRHIKDRHLKKECQYVLEECKWDCGRKYARKDIRFHEQDECDHRPLELVLLKKVEALERQCEAQHKDITRQRESLEEKDRIIKEMKEKMDEDREKMETKMANGIKELETKIADNAKELGKEIAANREKNGDSDNRFIESHKEMTERVDEMEQNMKRNENQIAAVKKDGKEGLENVHKRMEEEKEESKRELVEAKQEVVKDLNVRIDESKKQVTFENEKKFKADLKQLENNINNKIKQLEEKITKMDKELKDTSAAVKVAGDLAARVQTVQDGLKKMDTRIQREATDRINNIDKQFDINLRCHA